MRASVCGYGKDSAFALRDSGASVFTGEGDEDCASALRCSGSLCCLLNVTPPAPCRRALPLGTRDTLTTRSICCSEGLDIKPHRFVFPGFRRWVICCITPFALQMRRLKGFFALFPDFKKVRSSTASAEMTRQVEISTLSAYQMAHAGVVAHTSSWTPAAYELEESSPPLDSHIGGLPEAPDGKRE